jgi:hypothetical protein
MRLKQFLQESITQFEFRDVLKNKNLLAGCEFEFYLPEDTDTVSQHLDEVRNLTRKVEIEVREQQKNVDEYWEKKEELEDELKELQDIVDEQDFDDPLKKMKSEDDVKQKEVEIKNLQNEYSLSSYDLDYYTELIELIYEVTGGYEPKDGISSEEGFNQFCYQWIFEDGEIPSPEDLFGKDPEFLVENDEVDKFEAVRDLDFPLDWNNVTTDSSASDKYWKIVDDGSLTTNEALGVEVVTPTMQISELIDTIEEVFDWIDSTDCWTDSTCGFHVHVSLIPNKHNEVDPVKLMLFTEEGLVYKNFEERIGNSMTRALKEIHLSNDKTFSQKTVKQVLNTDIKNVSLFKFSGLHLVDLKDNHVEYRYMGATNYQKKFNETKINIVNYGHWLSVACDKEYKRKEYARKVANIVDMFNGVWVRLMIDQIPVLISVHHRDEKKVTKLKKLYTNTIRKLKFYKNINQELYSKLYNKNILDRVKKEIEDLVK